MTDETIIVGQTLNLTYYVTKHKNKVSNASEIEFTTGKPSEDELKYGENLFWTPEETGNIK